MSIVAKRYAEALFDISKEKSAIDKYKEDLEMVVEVFTTNTEFKSFLINPKIKNSIKIEVFNNIFNSSLNTDVKNLILILIEKGRIIFLIEIFKELEQLINKEKNILEIIITSALPLQDQEVKSIVEKYKKLYNVLISKVVTNVDNSLIGGLKIRIGDKVMDASVKYALENLKASILQS